MAAAGDERTRQPDHTTPAEPNSANAGTVPKRSVRAAAASRPNTWPTLNPENTNPTVLDRSVSGTVDARMSVSAAQIRNGQGQAQQRVWPGLAAPSLSSEELSAA